MKAITVFISTLLAAVSVADPASTALPLPPHEVLVLKHANVIDGLSARPLRDVTVVVRDGRIESVSRGPTRVPAGARIIDLGGRWLLPGLVDAHVHLRDPGSARAALRSGVTTARSLGVPHFADIDIRQRHRAGESDLPDVVAAGYHVRRRLAPEFFLDAPQLSRLAGGIHGPEDVRQAVRVMAGRGADVIKVMATERAGLTETDPLGRVLTDEELAAAVAEAKSAGLPVAAHAHSDEGARAAVLAGARTIEHGTLAGRRTLALMRKRGACLVPTITFWQDMLDPGGEYDDPKLAARAKEMLPRVRAATALAWKTGVKVAAGSDMRYDASSTRTVAGEVAELVKAGMPPMDAIKAATSAAAGCLGVGGRTGAIRPGLEADLVVFGQDPLADVGVLRNPLMIVNDGQVVSDSLVQQKIDAPTGRTEVRVLSAVGMRQVMSDLGPKFERATGHRLNISYDSGGVIRKRLEGGEPADVVLIPRPGIDRLAAAGKVVAGSATDLATSRVGVAVRKGAPKPDVSTPEAFKRAMLGAKAIACPDPALGGSSGVHLVKVFERLGIAEAVKPRLVLVNTPGRAGTMPGHMVAIGKAEIALHQMQELMAVPGVEIVGPLPGDLQETFVFSAAIVAGAKGAEAAKALVDFLRTSEARAVVKAKGMEPATP